MTDLKIALLGPIHITISGAAVTDFSYAKVRALLIYLVAEREHAHERDALAELLWPDQPAGVGRSSLRQALAKLRQLLGDQGQQPPRLLVTRETVQFYPALSHDLDIGRFRDLVAACAAHPHGAGRDCQACAARWEQAVALYRGRFADGPLPRDSQAFEEWLVVQREWYEQQALDGLGYLAGYYERQGQLDRALDYARRQLALDRWREPAHRQVMRLLAAGGQRAAALAQYEECRRIMLEDLGVEPEPETTELYAQLRVSTNAPQLQPHDLPPIVYSLPAQPTSFIGRDHELRELAALFDNPACRLITVLGPGGVGKTRLALRLAEIIAPRFRHGACWAALASLSSAGQLVDTLGRTLGLALDDTGDQRASLCNTLAPRQLVLVLDTMEHLLDASDLLADLLRHAPNLCIVATSRERLQLQSEWVYDLAGLSYPRTARSGAAAKAADYEAVRLLMERARQVQGDMPGADEERAIASIARAVEGNPLALELAAAARRSRPFTAIAAAIEHDLDLLRASFRDLPDRHRSVRATLDYSWRLLSDGEQVALARLGVFRGGFTAAAARHVAGASESLLDGLADKSMLRRDGERFGLHELVRRFALEQLAARGLDEAARTSHLAYAVALAEAAEDRLAGQGQEEWLNSLEREHDNLRAALGWAVERNEAEQGQRLGAALTRFWWMRGHLREGRQWLDRCLRLGPPASAAAGELAHAELAARARALHGAGGLATQQGDFGVARALFEQSLALERIVGRQTELGRVLNNFAIVLMNLRDYDQAAALIEECLQVDRELNDQRGIAFDLGNLAQLACFQGDNERAVALYAESLALHRQSGDLHSVALMLCNTGGSLRLLGREAEAQSSIEEGLHLLREVGAAFGIAQALHELAHVACQAGDTRRARALVAECLPLLATLGNRAELARAVALLAHMAGSADDAAAGIRLWAASARLLAGADSDLQPPDKLEYEQRLANARAGAEPAQWANAWSDGYAMAEDAAIAYALDLAGAL